MESTIHTNMSKTDWSKNNIAKLFNLPKVESVLDVACGLSLKSKYIEADIRVGVDIYSEYFKHIEATVPYVVIKGDVRKLEEMFIPKSFDVVIALDIVEHLTKEEALKLIAECEKIAKIAVIIETPEGYIPQNLDILGHGGHEWQTHRCGWEVQEFKNLGYETILREYEMQDVKRHTELDIDKNIKLINAIKWLKY